MTVEKQQQKTDTRTWPIAVVGLILFGFGLMAGSPDVRALMLAVLGVGLLVGAYVKAQDRSGNGAP